MFYCVNCGTPRIDHAVYCHHCGRELNAPITRQLLIKTDGTATDQTVADQSKNERSTGVASVPWRGGHVALGIALVILSLIPVTAISLGIGSRSGSYEEATTVWVGIHVMALAIIAVVWRLGVYRRTAPWRLLGLSQLEYPVVKAGLLALATLGASLLFTVVYGAVVDLFSSDVFSPPDIGSDIAFPGAAAFFTFQAIAVVTPITEELFFRGFVFSGLLHRFGLVKAIVLSAAIFSAFHLSVGVVIPVFVTGLLLGVLYHKTGSIWPCILAHAGQNGLAVALQIYGV